MIHLCVVLRHFRSFQIELYYVVMTLKGMSSVPPLDKFLLKSACIWLCHLLIISYIVVSFIAKVEGAMPCVLH